MKTFNADELKEILAKHRKWWLDEEGGERANLSDADLRGADLRDADLRCADLRGADLSGADLSGADLRGANLSGANLSGADLRDADLRGADLRGANLRGADLSGADLRCADLRDADLRGADLSGADLSGVAMWGTFVENVYGQHFATIGNIGSRNAVTIYHVDLDRVFCGCFRGTLDEFKSKVARSYPEGHEHRIEYDIAIAFFEHAKQKLIKQ